MKNKFLLLTWLLAVPLLWPGCDKPNDCPELKLPPLTTEGLNTFGCVIDGEVWVPHVDWQLIQTPLDFGEITVVHSEDDNRFFIRVDRRPNQNCDTTDQVIQLSISLDSLNKGWLNYSSDFSDGNTVPILLLAVLWTFTSLTLFSASSRAPLVLIFCMNLLEKP